MLRSLPLPILLVLAVACGPESGQPTPVEKKDPSPAKGKSGQDGGLPVTGTPIFQRDTEAIARDLRALEKEGRPADADKLAAFERNVRRKIDHIDITLKALDVSISAESKQIVEKSYQSLLNRRMKVDKEVDGIWREITEIRDLLEGAAKGTDEIPPGLTEDELKDRRTDLEAAVRKLREKRAEISAELQKLHEQLKAEGKIPEQGATTLTQERNVLLELRKRAEKLLQP